MAVCLFFLPLLSSAQTAQDRYSVSIAGMYGWNETWKSHGGLDVLGYLPFSNNFEMSPSVEFHNPGVFAATVVATPKIPLKTGELFFDCAAHYRNLSSFRVADFNAACSFGYRMDYVSVQLGVMTHLSVDTEHTSGNVVEPVNLLYRLAFNVRPFSSRWNLGAGAANFTEFEYERPWQAIFFLNGHYDINDNISLLFRGDLKPAGLFHITTQFWGMAARIGVKLRF